jgi:hypothetical protein
MIVLASSYHMNQQSTPIAFDTNSSITYVVPHWGRVLKKALMVLFKKNLLEGAYKIPYVSWYTYTAPQIHKQQHSLLIVFLKNDQDAKVKVSTQVEQILEQFLWSTIHRIFPDQTSAS